MKSLIILSPLPLKNKNQSSISIRIDQIQKKFKEMGLQVKKTDNLDILKKNNFDYIYLLISSKDDSISTRYIENKNNDAKVIVDLFTPLLLEKEAYLSKIKPQDWFKKLKMKKCIKKILQKGDIFLVANGRQKEYWVATAKNLSVPIKRSKIYSAPSGSPTINVVKNYNKNIILWFGGIYPWLNPEPLVEAFINVAPKFKNWRLRIIGGYHPDTGYSSLYKSFLKKAEGVAENQIEIIEWQAFDKLGLFLEDVAFAVHLPRHTKEDYYSHRVRLLTLVNAGIPILTSGSDFISRLIIKNKAGIKTSSNVESIEKNLIVMANSNLLQFQKNAKKIQPLYINKETEKIIL